MAHIEADGFDELLKMLDKLSDKSKIDDMAKAAVDKAKETVASAMRSKIAASETHHGSSGKRHRADRTTGSVSASVKATSAKVNSYGVFSVAKPEGRDKYGKRNAEKAALLEHGSHTLNARPWHSAAVSASEGPAKQIIEDYITKEMGCE